MFYKCVLLILGNFWSGFTNNFSGQIIFEPFLYQFSNMLFTAVPIVWFAVMDYEVSKEDLYTKP